jgi:hypothetical protein
VDCEGRHRGREQPVEKLAGSKLAEARKVMRRAGLAV